MVIISAKKILLIFVIFIATAGIILGVFINSMKSELTGQWESTSSDEECFTSLTFTDGPAKNRGISFDETNGNTKTVYTGIHEVKDNQLHVEVKNFDVEPFVMTYTLEGNQLNLQYTWNEEEYSCTYKLIE